MQAENTPATSCDVSNISPRSTPAIFLLTRTIIQAVSVWLVGVSLASALMAQTITVVGTRHLTGLEQAPTAQQFAHTVEALSAFRPTQVCVERMSGERIEMLIADAARNGATFQSDWHGRPLSSVIVPIGVTMQLELERRAADARSEAKSLLARWDALGTEERVSLISLQLAGFEFHSAVLNWSWLEDSERQRAEATLGHTIAASLNETMSSTHEAYSLGVPLARAAGLHELCTADSQEDETSGILVALQHDGEAVLDDPRVKARFDQLNAKMETVWQPESGEAALTRMLEFYNGAEYAELDRRLQWETLREFDNEEHALHRRLMYWHARTAEISAELFRALARGPEERVLLIIGSAHRSFTEADLQAQPWIEVQPASTLLEQE